MRLAVELYDTRLGTLEGGPLDFDFTASSEDLLVLVQTARSSLRPFP